MIVADHVQMTDEVRAAQGGDVAAFAALVDRFQPMANRYAASLLRDTGLADDACQEAFVEAFLHLHQLREPAAFAGWLRRIVVKHADRQRRSRLLFIELGEMPGAVDPLQAFIEAEERRQVAGGVAALSEPLRRTVELFYGQGFAVADIAEFLDVPPGAVRKRLHDARHRLRSVLATPHSRASESPRDTVQLLIASRVGDARGAAAILARRPDLANLAESLSAPDDSQGYGRVGAGWTVLQRATYLGHRDVVRVLLTAGARTVPAAGTSALDLAVLQGDAVTVRLLLDVGADPNRAAGELTPLHRAAMRGRLEIARSLLDAGADPDPRGPGGRTAAEWSRLKGHQELAVLLEGKGK